uniref:Uncharacterized protein n=1 Tax=Sphaeramia orbicularis TaxID=375764 RepID=A0A673A4K6_9TELE
TAITNTESPTEQCYYQCPKLHREAYGGDAMSRLAKQLVRTDRRLTVRMMAEQLSLNREPVRTILAEELGMRKECAKMVPKDLSDDQKEKFRFGINHRNSRTPKTKSHKAVPEVLQLNVAILLWRGHTCSSRTRSVCS